MGRGLDGCERRIEVFVKIQKKKKLGGGRIAGGGGGLQGGGAVWVDVLFFCFDCGLTSR